MHLLERIRGKQPSLSVVLHLRPQHVYHPVSRHYLKRSYGSDMEGLIFCGVQVGGEPMPVRSCALVQPCAAWARETVLACEPWPAASLVRGALCSFEGCASARPSELSAAEKPIARAARLRPARSPRWRRPVDARLLVCLLSIDFGPFSLAAQPAGQSGGG